MENETSWNVVVIKLLGPLYTLAKTNIEQTSTCQVLYCMVGNKDWEKIHAKQFSKMKSLDQYVAEKNARIDKMSASLKKIRQMRDTMKSNVESLKNYRTPPSVKKVDVLTMFCKTINRECDISGFSCIFLVLAGHFQ